MKINEIFRSIQGESSYAGLPCVFVRLTGCNLKCNYCDTKYAYEEGTEQNNWDVTKKVLALYKPGDLIEFTGGEPLLQTGEINEVIKTLKFLSNLKYNEMPHPKELPYYRITDKILIETNGSIDIDKVNRKFRKNNIIIVMDFKSPSSGMRKTMLESNLEKLTKYDELKFVIGTDEDYNDMKHILEKYYPKSQTIISTIYGADKKHFVERMLKDNINARFQVQLHKLIWNPEKRGV